MFFFDNIKEIDLSNNKALTYLNCGDNQLTSLDISNNIELIELDCSDNQLKELDIRNNSLLESVNCEYNLLNTIYSSPNDALTGLDCSNNQLTILLLNNYKKLGHIDCDSNKLTELDFSNNSLLTSIHCSDNKIKQLDFSNNPLLIEVFCDSNCLSYLDLSNTVVEYFRCWDEIGEIFVTENNDFDLRTLPGNFDISKASKWEGGIVNGSVLTFTKQQVTYTYDVGCGWDATFTLVAKNYNSIDSDSSQPSITPLLPTTQDQSNDITSDSKKDVTLGSIIIDNKTKAKYKIIGKSASGYSVSCVKFGSNKIKTAVIPDFVAINGVSYKVTSIAPNAFKKCKKLKKVTIGAGVTEIGKNAFSGCKNLKNVIVKSKSLKKIGKNAFKGINKTAKIKVPKKKIKAYTKLFRKAKVAKSVKITK